MRFTGISFIWILFFLSLPAVPQSVREMPVPTLAPIVQTPIPIPVPVAAAPISAAEENFRQAFEQYIHDTLLPATPGFALAVVIDGKPLLTKGYGVREAGSTEAVDSHTVFRLASVSKTFASAAAGVLVQNGTLQWDSKVMPYLNGMAFKNPEYAQQLTLRHLLSHTSGLVPHAYTNLVDHNVAYEKILEKIKNIDFVCMPGNCYGYQNVVYSLVGNVIESAAGEPYEAIVTKHLFSPLQMTDASYGLKSFVDNENHATPHVWRNGRWKPVKVKDNYYGLAPAAGVNASIADMSQWLMAQLGYRKDVLPDHLLADMHSKQIKTARSRAQYGQGEDASGAYYGLGWRVFDYAGHENFVHHGGWVQGVRTEMVFNRELKMGLVLLTNSETRHAGNILRDFLEFYAQHISL